MVRLAGLHGARQVQLLYKSILRSLYGLWTPRE
jgi:hypothetical protein